MADLATDAAVLAARPVRSGRTSAGCRLWGP